jgi:anti-sigma regulatory factor (Ser/Thr protein kinase)
MRLAKLQHLLKATVFSCPDRLDREIDCVCDADLVSDVLSLQGLDGGSTLLLTSLVGPQLLNIVTLTGIKNVIFVQSRLPGSEVVRQAEREGIAFLSTPYGKYEAAGILYQAGMPSSCQPVAKQRTEQPLQEKDLLPIAEYTVSGGDFLAAGAATKKIKQRLENLGLLPEVVRRMAVAAFEAEMNVIIHATRARMQLSLGRRTVQLVVDDEGPGIPDVELAMQEGYSTAPPAVREMGYGAGMGLPNIRKCADSFILDTCPGSGTKLRIAVHYQDAGEERDE